MNETEQLKELHRIQVQELRTRLAATEEQLAAALAAHCASLERQLAQAQAHRALLAGIREALSASSAIPECVGMAAHSPELPL